MTAGGRAAGLAAHIRHLPAGDPRGVADAAGLQRTALELGIMDDALLGAVDRGAQGLDVELLAEFDGRLVGVERERLVVGEKNVVRWLR